MKSKLLFLLLLLGSSYITAQTVIENPPFETRQGSIHTISKIELSPTETRLTIRTVFRPQWWTSLDSLTYIYAPESKKQLYPLRIEGRKFGEQVTTPASGIIEDDCVITYPPLPEGTTRIDWMDDNLNSETNTYGILLVKPQETKEQASLRKIHGNWQQADAQNGWDIGIYDSLAIMDNRFWKYDLCRKQGKKFKLNLKDETGEQCLLEITQEKDGNLCIGKNGGKANKYIRAGRPQRNYAATTAATAPQTAFFRKDTVHIRGFLDGYSPKLGFTTVLIYTDNHITNEGTPAVVTIHPDGRFESDFVVNYPGVHHLSMGNNWMTFYIRPGETLMLYINWEDHLDYLRQRRLKPMLTETLYMGPSSSINQELMPCEPLFSKDYHIIQNACKTLTPSEFKTQQEPMYKLWMHRVDSLEQSKTLQPEAMQMLKNDVMINYGAWLLEFILMRDMDARKDTTNTILKIKETPDYYDFLKAMPLNDVRSIGCNNFSTFINRIEFMNPFLPASWQIKNGTDDRMEKYAESWRKKKEILQDTTGMSFPVVGELILTRSYPFLAKTLENEKKAFALLDTLKGYLHDPFLVAEAERMYRQVYPVQGNKPQELPAGKGTDIIRKLTAPYLGKFVIIDFWATSCGPCRASIEQHADLRKEYRNSPDIKFIFVTSNQDSPEKAYENYVEKHLKEETIFRLPQSDYNYLRELFHFNGIPRYVLLNRDGKLLDENFPMYNIELFLKESKIRKE